MKALKKGAPVLAALPVGRFLTGPLELVRTRVVLPHEPGGPGGTFIVTTLPRRRREEWQRADEGGDTHRCYYGDEHLRWVRGHFGTRAQTALATTISLGDPRG